METSWNQSGDYFAPSLFPGAPVIEGTIRLGVISEHDEMRCQVEVRNPVTGELLALRSWWSVPAPDRIMLLETAQTALVTDMIRLGVPLEYFLHELDRGTEYVEF